jgi:hypothetical protein
LEILQTCASEESKLLAAMSICWAIEVAQDKNTHGIGPNENRSSYKEIGLGYSVGEEWLGTKLVRNKSTSQSFPTLVHWTLFDIIEN